MIANTGSDSVGGGGGVVADIFPVNKSISLPRFPDIFGTFSDHPPFMDTHGTHFPRMLTHSNHVTTSINSGKNICQKFVRSADISGLCSNNDCSESTESRMMLTQYHYVIETIVQFKI